VPDADRAVTVTLEEFPTELFAAFDEASEGLLREYGMVAASGAQPFSFRDVAVAREAKLDVGAAAAGATRHIALRVAMSSSTVAGFSILQAVLDHANRLARDERLLCLPVLPEIVAFRDWMCGEIVNQASGAAPRAWRLPTAFEQPGVPVAEWSGIDDLDQDELWLVGDDSNRIVAVSAAALRLLGWDALVGERILVIIPPEFREAHIARFTQAVVTRDDRRLDQPLQVAAMTRDQEEIPITLTLTRHSAAHDRSVYLARLAPRDSTA